MDKPDIFGNGKANYSIMLIKVIDVNAKSEDDAVGIVREFMFGELQFSPNDLTEVFEVKTKELK